MQEHFRPCPDTHHQGVYVCQYAAQFIPLAIMAVGQLLILPCCTGLALRIIQPAGDWAQAEHILIRAPSEQAQKSAMEHYLWS